MLVRVKKITFWTRQVFEAFEKQKMTLKLNFQFLFEKLEISIELLNFDFEFLRLNSFFDFFRAIYSDILRFDAAGNVVSRNSRQRVDTSLCDCKTLCRIDLNNRASESDTRAVFRRCNPAKHAKARDF